jgi:hypothetical protein
MSHEFVPTFALDRAALTAFVNPHGITRTTVDPNLIAAYNAGVRAARLANRETVRTGHVCAVTLYVHKQGVHDRPCSLPLVPGAQFCVKHEADRIRLGGDRG